MWQVEGVVIARHGCGFICNKHHHVLVRGVAALGGRSSRGAPAPRKAPRRSSENGTDRAPGKGSKRSKTDGSSGPVQGGDAGACDVATDGNESAERDGGGTRTTRTTRSQRGGGRDTASGREGDRLGAEAAAATSGSGATEDKEGGACGGMGTDGEGGGGEEEDGEEGEEEGEEEEQQQEKDGGKEEEEERR